MTRRRWIADTWNNTTATLEGDQARHLSRVLRAQPGMEFDVVAGGAAWLARVASVAEERVLFTLIAEIEAAAALPLTLLLSVFKYDRMEWAIEKAVELGASRILPVVADRTEKHLAQAAAKRVERWRRIALEAAKQSRRTDLPQIGEPAPIAAILSTGHDSAEDLDAGEPVHILLSEAKEEQSLLRILEERMEPIRKGAEVQLAVGPEGGWTPKELDSFAQSGWRHAGLGPRILRVETAAIAALTIVNAIREA